MIAEVVLALLIVSLGLYLQETLKILNRKLNLIIEALDLQDSEVKPE